jgi:hypothetical protein
LRARLGGVVSVLSGAPHDRSRNFALRGLRLAP